MLGTEARPGRAEQESAKLKKAMNSTSWPVRCFRDLVNCADGYSLDAGHILGEWWPAIRVSQEAG
jgi:hypothetical protein